MADSELELSHSLDERRRFDISDCSTKLPPVSSTLFDRPLSGSPRQYKHRAALQSRPQGPLRPARSNLESRSSNGARFAPSFQGSLLFARSISTMLMPKCDTHLAVNDMLVHLSRGHIVVLSQANVEVTFIVPEIQIRLSSIVQDIDLTCYSVHEHVV